MQWQLLRQQSSSKNVSEEIFVHLVICVTAPVLPGRQTARMLDPVQEVIICPHCFDAMDVNGDLSPIFRTSA
jgi:hypothetical protein